MKPTRTEYFITDCILFCLLAVSLLIVIWQS